VRLQPSTISRLVRSQNRRAILQSIEPIQEAVDIVVRQEYVVMVVIGPIGCEAGGSEELRSRYKCLSILDAGEVTDEYDRPAEAAGNAARSSFQF
jgi:hypothetical protein